MAFDSLALVGHCWTATSLFNSCSLFSTFPVFSKQSRLKTLQGVNKVNAVNSGLPRASFTGLPELSSNSFLIATGL